MVTKLGEGEYYRMLHSFTDKLLWLRYSFDFLKFLIENDYNNNHRKDEFNKYLPLTINDQMIM